MLRYGYQFPNITSAKTHLEDEKLIYEDNCYPFDEKSPTSSN